jgi:malate dehydrogenase
MAFAGARFTDSLLRALNGEKKIVEPTFVESNVVPGVSFFATNVELGRGGVEKIHEIGPISSYEKKLLDACIPELKKNIEKGVDFAKKNL